jgi:hypothetical protein
MPPSFSRASYLENSKLYSDFRCFQNTSEPSNFFFAPSIFRSYNNWSFLRCFLAVLRRSLSAFYSFAVLSSGQRSAFGWVFEDLKEIALKETYIKKDCKDCGHRRLQKLANSLIDETAFFVDVMAACLITQI